MSRSTPAYQSPLRHHRRNASQHREVKETLNARSEYMNNEEDGRAEHHINQYVIKDEIGRGSFGAVHLAIDQYGKEYVRESSKALEQAAALFVTADRRIGSQGILESAIAETSAVEYPPKPSLCSTTWTLSRRSWTQCPVTSTFCIRHS